MRGRGVWGRGGGAARRDWGQVEVGSSVSEGHRRTSYLNAEAAAEDGAFSAAKPEAAGQAGSCSGTRLRPGEAETGLRPGSLGRRRRRRW